MGKKTRFFKTPEAAKGPICPLYWLSARSGRKRRLGVWLQGVRQGIVAERASIRTMCGPPPVLP